MSTPNNRTTAAEGQWSKTAPFDYQSCAASTTTSLGPRGAVGDILDKLIITVNTAATAQVQIQDGSDTAITIFPNSPGQGVGMYPVPIGIASRTGQWKIVAGAGSTVVAVGFFS